MNDAPTPAVLPAVDDLIRRLRSADDGVRGPAWQHAGPLGAPAVAPLVRTMSDPDRETARAARRALWSVVDYAGRPGADPERAEVAAELSTVLDRVTEPVATRREAVWMLSTIADSAAVDVVAARLKEAELREDARCVLQRIPGKQALMALRVALMEATDDFAAALADALRARGEVVPGRPSRRLVPSRITAVGV